MRLQDQYIEFGAALAGGIILGIPNWQIVWWGIVFCILSVPAYIINELVDGRDTDKYSWNPHHVRVTGADVPTIWLLCGTISIIGLVLAYALGFFWWGFAIWGIGILYSVEPFRFKRRFFFDLFIQIAVWWLIPLLSIIWGAIPWELSVSLCIITGLMITGAGFPYQLADYSADRKCGLSNTHVSLGMNGSLQLGFWISVSGLSLAIVFGFLEWAAWTIPIMLLSAVVIWRYWYWLGLHTSSHQIESIRRYVRVVKPLSRYIVPFLFIYWRMLS